MTPDLRFEKLASKAMPQIELEKMLNVLFLRKNKGYSQFELSFLMGQRDFYVRDVENPNHTLVYAVPFTNIFRQIFGCDIRAIVPDTHRKPAYSIRITEVESDAGATVFKAEKKTAGGGWQLIDTLADEPKDLLLPAKGSDSPIPEPEIKDWVIAKAKADYFTNAKHALLILRDCEKEFDGSVRPLFLAKALKACNGTKGLPKLKQWKDGNGTFVYGG